MVVANQLFDALTAANIPRDHAHAVVDALEHRMTSELATKADVAELRGETKMEFAAVKADITELRSETKTEFAAVKADVAELRSETKMEFAAVKADIAELRSETKMEFAAVKADITTLRSETKADLTREITGVKIDIARLETQIADLHRKLTIQLGGMMVATAGTLFAALKYL